MNNIEMLKKLRDSTGAGMKSCKDSLEESNWDYESALDLLKTKGLNIISNYMGKPASEGVIAIDKRANWSSMVEVNCNTDFCAKTDDFRIFAQSVATALSDAVHFENELNVNDSSILAFQNKLVSTFRENISIGRMINRRRYQAYDKVFDYLHSNQKIGVLVTLGLDSSLPNERASEIFNSKNFNQLGNDIAMQIAAMNPLAISFEKLDASNVDRQKNIFQSQLASMNKPEASWPKIMEGKLTKWYKEVCLLNQESVVMPKITVEQMIKNVSPAINVINFERYQVGEGLEAQNQNFAEEVLKLAEV